MPDQNAPIRARVQRVDTQRAENKRRVSKIQPSEYMPKLRADAPRMLRAYGSIGKLAGQLGIRKSDALDLVLVELVKRIPLQQKRRKK